jgi:hypothetical protein
MVEHFDGVGKQFENTAFRTGAEYMYENGYTFDFISDRQIENSAITNGMITTEGKASYKTIVIPHCEYIPLGTIAKIISLAEEGATIVAYKGFPTSIAGYADKTEKENQFHGLIDRLKVISSDRGVQEMQVGKGRVVVGDDLEQLLTFVTVQHEPMVENGLQYIRKKDQDGNIVYFIANNTDQAYEGWVSLQSKAESVVLLDPMTGEIGKVNVKKEANTTQVYLQLTARQTIFVKLYDNAVSLPDFNYWNPTKDSVSLNGTWKVTFTKGGPTLPSVVKTDTLKSWTQFAGNIYQTFSGTATYTIEFDKPAIESRQWLLKLGKVKETAAIYINGNYITTLIGPVYQVAIDPAILQSRNILEVRVSNLMANRIADLDKRKVFWKKFYNVNFPSRKPENRVNGIFDASHWQPHESGLMGPVTLHALTRQVP